MDMADPHASGLLAGKVAIVTGASRGIGAGIARRVAYLLGPAAAAAAARMPDAVVTGLAVFTRADAHVDALASSLKGFGLERVEIL